MRPFFTDIMNDSPKPKKPLAAQLRRLYELEGRIHDLDPWQWLAPADIFCVQFEDREPLFVCFHHSGEIKAIDIAVGWPGYTVLLHVHTHKIHYPGFYFETRMLQVGRLDAQRTFEGEALNHEKYGREEANGAVPFFRTHNIGYVPWPVNRDEAALLCDVLYAVFGMAMRLEDFSEPLGNRAMEAVFTVNINADGALSAPEWVALPEIPPGVQADVNLPGQLLHLVRKLPEAPHPVEVEHIFLPVLPGKLRRGAPPETAYVFLLAGGADETIGGHFILHARGDIANVWTEFPVRLLEVFLRQRMRPPEILVTDSRLMTMLRPLTELLPTLKLTRAEELPVITREGAEVLKELTGG